MSYSLHLHTCNLGTAVKKGKNPFTGDVVEFPNDDGLNRSEREAVQLLLQEVQASEPDPDGYMKVMFSDNGVANIGDGNLDDRSPCIAFAMEINMVTPQLVSFIYNLTRAGNMSIGSSIDPSVVALTSPTQDKKLLKRWPAAQVIESPLQLKKWLEENIKEGRIV